MTPFEGQIALALVGFGLVLISAVIASSRLSRRRAIQDREQELRRHRLDGAFAAEINSVLQELRN